jgi:hypothetical protein
MWMCCRPITSISAEQETLFPTIGITKDDVGILHFVVHAEMECVIRRCEETRALCTNCPLMLFATARVGPRLAMLHDDFCFHKFALMPEILFHCLLLTGPGPQGSRPQSLQSKPSGKSARRR